MVKTNTKKKILVLANIGYSLYRLRKELLIRLVEEYDVYVSLPKDNYTDEIKNLGCKFIETDLDRRGTSILTDLKLMSTYNNLLKEIQPDVVLTYTIKPNIYGGIVARKHKIPTIVNITGIGTALYSNILLTKVLKRMYKYATGAAHTIFFQNDANFKFFKDNNMIADNVNIDILPGSGVNVDEYNLLPYPDDTTTNFVFISRIMKDKGIDELLSAIDYFEQTEHDVHFNICGFCEDDYEGILNSYHEKGKLTYHGMVKDVRKVLRESHALIHPSYHEGMANVMLEAGSSGRPLLGTNIAGCKEMVDDETTGFLFEPKDKNDLIDKINKFLDLDYPNKKEMGLRSREKLSTEFDRNIVVNEYIKKIKEIGV